MKIEYSKGERASKELILLNRQSFEATSGRKMDELSRECYYLSVFCPIR